MDPQLSPHDFRNPYPRFLGELDTDRGRSEFVARAYAAIRSHRGVQTIASPEDREDVIEGILLLCLDHDARVLRRYEDRGRPFEAYFRTIVATSVYDFHRRRNREKVFYILPEYLGALLEEAGVDGRDPTPPAHLAEVVRRSVQSLERGDRSLVEMRFFHGMTPLQISRSIDGLTNVQVSERIRYVLRSELGPSIRRALREQEGP